MRKQCRECKSVWEAAAPYCQACGCQFTRVPPKQIDPPWKYRLSAIAVGLAVAVLQHLLQS